MFEPSAQIFSIADPSGRKRNTPFPIAPKSTPAAFTMWRESPPL